MMKRLGNFLFFCSLAGILAFSNFAHVNAQEIDNADFGSGEVSLFQLGEDEFTLVGPFDSEEVLFGVPPSWKLKGGAELEMFLGVTYSDLSTSGLAAPQAFRSGGAVTVILNNVILGVFYLEDTGELSVKYPIPFDALRSRRDDGLMELEFILGSGVDCELDQSTLAIIRPSTKLTLPHDDITPDTSLINFPRPLYSDSFVRDSAIVVLPDQPSSIELQSALTIGAGLGKIAGNDFSMSLLPVSKLNATLLNTSHLIFVGQPSSFSSYFSQLDTQSLVVNGKYKVTGAESEDGVVQLLASPWSRSHVVLLVSGNNDAGILKSAQAISTGVLRSGPYSNVAVVKNVQSVILPEDLPVDFTLSDLGYTTDVFESRGSTTFSYDFNVPAGKVVGSDAFFELAYGHSGLLNYDRSGLVVLLNGQPIGSVMFTNETASQPVNRLKVSIPSSLVQIGVNQIDVLANVVPFDICTSQDINSEWVTIWSDSRLHLPLSDLLSVSPNAVSDLSVYPAPFINNPALDTTAFVFSQNDFESWRAAFGIATFLGNNVNGNAILLKAFYSDQLSDADYASYNFIVVGKPNDVSFVALINDNLPGPFDENSNIAIEKNMPATFLIPTDTPIGYVELLQSPWDHNKVIVAALGNSPIGIAWAATVLGDSPLGSQLAGNFAVVNDQRVLTTDTRLVPLTNSNLDLPSDVATPVPTSVTFINVQDEGPYYNNSWILPVLAVLFILIVVVLLVVGYNTWFNNRTRDKNKLPDKS